MSDEIEFPQADQAIQYIARKVGLIEDQFACNAGYHRDHKELRRRIDKIDRVLSQLNSEVIKLDTQRIMDGISLARVAYLEEMKVAQEIYINEVRKTQETYKTEMDETRAQVTILREELSKSERNLHDFNKNLAANSKNIVKNIMEDAFENAVRKACRISILKYIVVGIICLAIGVLL